jgi:hypothetical protein
VRQLNRLQNMRFVHSLDMNESLPDSESSRYNVNLLDASQLAAQRAWQVDFMSWQKREKRRARKLAFRPVGEERPSTPSKARVPQEPAVVHEQLAFGDGEAVVGDVDTPVEAPG